MYGSRLETTITSAPRSSRSRISRSVSGVHASRSSSRELMLGLEIADQCAEILGERLILRRRASRRRTQQPFAAEQRAHARAPSRAS